MPSRRLPLCSVRVSNRGLPGIWTVPRVIVSAKQSMVQTKNANARTYVRTGARAHGRRHARTHGRTDARTHARTHARTRTRTQAHTHAHAQAHIDAHTHTHARVLGHGCILSFLGYELYMRSVDQIPPPLPSDATTQKIREAMKMLDMRISDRVTIKSGMQKSVPNEVLVRVYGDRRAHMLGQICFQNVPKKVLSSFFGKCF